MCVLPGSGFQGSNGFTAVFSIIYIGAFSSHGGSPKDSRSSMTGIPRQVPDTFIFRIWNQGGLPRQSNLEETYSFST